MYFVSRLEAGQRIASVLEDYCHNNCIVVALTDGSVQIGKQIATHLDAPLVMLLSEDIPVPGESQSFGTLNQSGRFTYNGMFSAGEIDEYYSEYHGYLEDQKREKMSKINKLLGADGIVGEWMLQDRNVILVSDGLATGASLDAAADFLKPLMIKRLIIVAPVASVAAVDRAHIVADELHILNVADNYLDTNHYYDENDVPDHEGTLAALDKVIPDSH